MAGFARRVAFSLVPLAVLLVGGELGLRAAGWPRADAAFDHNEPYWVTDPNLRAEAFPHREEGRVFHVSTNADGLRAPLHHRAKPPGVRRVMALGCSTTFGWGVEDDESWPARLEAELALHGHEGWEVVNGGQPGYTTFQGLWLWDRVLREYAPDVVLVGYVVQDARRASYTDRSQAILQRDARFLKDHLLWRSRLYLGLRALLGQVQLRARRQGGTWRVPPEEYAENLRALVGRILAVGGLPVLFGFPLEHEGYTETHRRILEAAAIELDFPYLDLQPRMEETARERRLYFEHDRGHPNAQGCALIARWVHEWLDEQGLLEGG